MFRYSRFSSRVSRMFRVAGIGRRARPAKLLEESDGESNPGFGRDALLPCHRASARQSGRAAAECAPYDRMSNDRRRAVIAQFQPVRETRRIRGGTKLREKIERVGSVSRTRTGSSRTVRCKGYGMRQPATQQVTTTSTTQTPQSRSPAGFGTEVEHEGADVPGE